jgi:hypothetical protein
MGKRFVVIVLLNLAATPNVSGTVRNDVLRGRYNRQMGSIDNHVEVPLPSIIGEMTEIQFSGTVGETDASLSLPLSPPGHLVTLTALKDIDRTSTLIPVGRSYENFDWESVAGPKKKEYICNGSNSDRKCLVNVSLEQNSTFYLTMYEHSLSPRNEVSRFLERVSFGPTRADLNSWDYDTSIKLSFANYVTDQMYNQETSSHFEFYYKRRFSSQNFGYHAVTKACDQNSLWRAFTFLSREKNFEVKITRVDNGDEAGYVLSQNGHVRTVLTEPLQYYEDSRFWISTKIEGTLDASGSYAICRLFEFDGSDIKESRSKDNPRTFGLYINGKCKHIVGGNPSVNLDPRFVDMDSLFLLDMSSLDTTTEIVEIEKNSSEAALQQTPYALYLLKKPGGMLGDEHCNIFPDPALNDVSNPDQPVFGKLPNGKYVIHDYYQKTNDNTLNNPIMDGGVSNYESYAEKNPAITSDIEFSGCANRPQDVFNENNCKLSYEPNVCIPKPPSWHRFDYLRLTLALDQKTILALNDLNEGNVYAVDGLRFEDGNIPSWNSYPCEQRWSYFKWYKSRWVKVDADECLSPSAVTLSDETKSALEYSIYASNDFMNRHGIRDVHLLGSCHDDDKQKVGMNIFVSAENQCYRHVHPQYM